MQAVRRRSGCARACVARVKGCGRRSCPCSLHAALPGHLEGSHAPSAPCARPRPCPLLPTDPARPDPPPTSGRWKRRTQANQGISLVSKLTGSSLMEGMGVSSSSLRRATSTSIT